MAPARDALDALAPLLPGHPPQPGSARDAWRRQHTGHGASAADTPQPWARHVVPALDIAAQGVLLLLDLCTRETHHWKSLRAAPARAEHMWHEMLRLQAPCPGAVHEIRRGIRLTAGPYLPAGTRVWLLYGSAGRDMTQWGPDADRYRPGRPMASSHLTLGEGPCQSTGRQLAALYATTLLSALARRCPRMETDGEPSRTTRLKGVTSLPLRLPRPRARPAVVAQAASAATPAP